MNKNVGSYDRGIRLAAGLVLIGTGLYFGNWWGAIGVLPLVTGVLQGCPAYLPFDISTRSVCLDADDDAQKG